jgi:hypothetical protein
MTEVEQIIDSGWCPGISEPGFELVPYQDDLQVERVKRINRKNPVKR